MLSDSKKSVVPTGPRAKAVRKVPIRLWKKAVPMAAHQIHPLKAAVPANVPKVPALIPALVLAHVCLCSPAPADFQADLPTRC